MEVAYVVCPDCELRFCVGAEFRRRPSMLCHCPRCAHEFSFGAALPAPGDVDTAEVSPWV